MNKVFNELGNITSYTVEVESWKRLHDSYEAAIFQHIAREKHSTHANDSVMPPFQYCV